MAGERHKKYELGRGGVRWMADKGNELLTAQLRLVYVEGSMHLIKILNHRQNLFNC